VEEKEAPVPEFDIWDHLDNALQAMHDEAARKLSADALELYDSLAALLVDAKYQLRVDKRALEQRVRIDLGLKVEDPGVLLAGLFKIYSEGRVPWLVHGVERKVAENGIKRTFMALRRFAAVAPHLGAQPMPERAVPYVRQVVETFLFGFDEACIALCRATLEQVGRNQLIALGQASEREFRQRPGVTLEGILLRLKSTGALVTAFDRAEKLRLRGRELLHRSFPDPKIRERHALDCVEDLVAVLREILP
jgi:hypothetical protein